MRILVCGSRTLPDAPWVYAELAGRIRPGDVVMTGGATGADRIAAEFARGLGCEVLEFRANWASHGKAAGPRRNARMLVEGHPDVVLAFPGGRGTADLVRRAREASVLVVEVTDTLQSAGRS
jgi:predicted Rossmann-fold nucleotide-binding protein